MIQDCRGRYDSDGEWEVYVQDQDGHDTVEWLIRQPWCDGNVGMFGISYVGFTQMHPAPLASQGLKAILPIAATPDGFDLFWQQGAFLLQQASHFLQIGRRTSHAQGMAMLAGLPAGTMGVGGGKADDFPGDLSYLYERMPLYSAFDEYDDVKIWKELLDHNTLDSYWRKRIVNDRYGTIEAPAYFLTGWWDCTVRHMFEAFVNWTEHAQPEARSRTKIMCGPWTHTRIGVADWGQDIGFGQDAELDIIDFHLRWYDQRLKGIPTGVDDEAPLQLFVCGDNVWRGEYEWPLARTEYRSLYLHGDGSANTRFGDGTLGNEPPTADEPPDTFEYDPSDPVPTMGGQVAYMDKKRPSGPVSHPRTVRYSRIHGRSVGERSRMYGPGIDGAVRGFIGDGHRLHRHPRRCIPGWTSHQRYRRDRPGSVPGGPPIPLPYHAGRCIPIPDRPVGGLLGVQSGSPHPARGVEQQLSPFRPQHQPRGLGR